MISSGMRARRLRSLQQKDAYGAGRVVGVGAKRHRDCALRRASSKRVPRGEGVSAADPCVSWVQNGRRSAPMSQIDFGFGSVSSVLFDSLLRRGLRFRRAGRFAPSLSSPPAHSRRSSGAVPAVPRVFAAAPSPESAFPQGAEAGREAARAALLHRLRRLRRAALRGRASPARPLL